jgi:uncharacterized protein (UPF0276 family)
METSPQLGIGVGLKTPHIVSLLANGRGPVDWAEASLEYLLAPDGKPQGRRLQIMEQVRAQIPLTLHSFALNLGSVDSLDRSLLSRVRFFMRALDVDILSEHLCWTAVDGERLFDLMPLPMTEACVRHLATRIARVQDALGVRILVEPVALNLDLAVHEMDEWTFLNEVARRADCYILLDIANAYISARNLGYDPKRYLDGIDHTRVRQIHLANYSKHGTTLIDTHSGAVSAPVLSLYEGYVREHGLVATNVEWDNNLPPWSRLQREVRRAARVAMRAATSGRVAA